MREGEAVPASGGFVGLSGSRIDMRAKGFPVLDGPLDPARIKELGWNLFDGSFLLPIMAVRSSALDHNIALLASYAEDHGVWLAPHGKTTMAPAIFRRQLDAGAWAMTLATAWQGRVAEQAGVERILIANEVVDPGGLDWLASTLTGGPEVYCWVDSIAGVDLLDARIGRPSRRLPVLLEIGLSDGRAGARDFETALAVARRIATSPALRLAGVSFFEGIAAGDTPEQRLAVVRDLIALARRVAAAIEDIVVAGGGTEIVLTGGGSQYPDVVVEGLVPPLGTRLATRVVLRSGCTVTHDHGGYDLTSPFGSNGVRGGPRLRAALEVWAPVLSTPEPGRAIVGAGKRDLSFDAGMPPVLARRGSDGVRREVRGDELAISRLNDQHAYVTVAGGPPLVVGDLIAIGIRHACTAMDRWRWLPVIDDEDRVVDAIELIF